MTMFKGRKRIFAEEPDKRTQIPFRPVLQDQPAADIRAVSEGEAG